MSISIFASTAAVLFSLLLPAQAQPEPARGPVIVELFTSEGCSSCPPADALLAKLDQERSAKGPEVLILGEHVDYWNELGWKDRFSSSAYSRRQRQYVSRFRLNSAYTPQAVIDGRYQLVGNDESMVREKIAAAAATAKDAVIRLSWKNGKLGIDVESPGKSAEILLAVTENGLSTSVSRGENGGRTLRHSGVVRELRTVGSLKSGRFSSLVPISPGRDWTQENLRIVVFAQKPDSGEIIGAAGIDFAPNTAVAVVR